LSEAGPSSSRSGGLFARRYARGCGPPRRRSTGSPRAIAGPAATAGEIAKDLGADLPSARTRNLGTSRAFSVPQRLVGSPAPFRSRIEGKVGPLACWVCFIPC
jgi:hypothetical protein